MVWELRKRIGGQDGPQIPKALPKSLVRFPDFLIDEQSIGLAAINFEAKCFQYFSRFRISTAVHQRPELVPVAVGLSLHDPVVHQHDCIINFSGHLLEFGLAANSVKVGVEH